MFEIIPHSLFFLKEKLKVYNKLKIYKIQDNIQYVQSLQYSFICILLVHQPSHFPKSIIILHIKWCRIKDNAQLRDEHLEIISQLHVMTCAKIFCKNKTLWEELMQSLFFQMFLPAEKNYNLIFMQLTDLSLSKISDSSF